MIELMTVWAGATKYSDSLCGGGAFFFPLSYPTRSKTIRFVVVVVVFSLLLFVLFNLRRAPPPLMAWIVRWLLCTRFIHYSFRVRCGDGGRKGVHTIDKKSPVYICMRAKEMDHLRFHFSESMTMTASSFLSLAFRIFFFFFFIFSSSLCSII